ncbi:MAG: response regulator [Chitinophagales bacterium]
MINLMLVDDDKLAALIARKMLERASGKFEISVYLNGINALKVLKNQRELPDAILLDINMPQINGWKFLDSLNKMNVFTDVIMLTASLYEDDMQKAKEYPQVKGFFQKPLDKTKIVKLLRYYARP